MKIIFSCDDVMIILIIVMTTIMMLIVLVIFGVCCVLPCVAKNCAMRPVFPERHLDAARQKLPRDNFCRSLAAQLPSPRGQF